MTTPTRRLCSFLTTCVICVLLGGASAPPYAGAAQGTYVVQPNDTLSGIALRYGTTVAALVAANNLPDANHIVVGQALSLAGGGTSPAVFSAPASGSGTGAYVVQPGDTLFALSQRFGVSLSSLVSVNGVANPSTIVVGQQLTIPAIGGGGAPAFTPATQITPSSSTYTVQPGDTLSGIAVHYGVTLDSLVAANNLSVQSVLNVGEQLTIPAASPGYAAAASVDQGTIGQILSAQALAAGVDPGLVEAVAWQESGWQMVTASDGGMGVMQLMPDTVTWVSNTLLGYPVNPYDPTDNIRAGVAMLRYFLQYYGNASLAVAAYHQGMTSLAANGILPETQSYIDNVLALQQRFGG